MEIVDDGQPAATDTAMTAPLAQIQPEQDVVVNSGEQDRSALSSSTMGEGSALENTLDASFTADEDIDSLFG